MTQHEEPYAVDGSSPGPIARRLRMLMDHFGPRGLPIGANELARVATERARQLGFPGASLTRQSVNNLLAGRTRYPSPIHAGLIAAVYGVSDALLTPTPAGQAAELKLAAAIAGRIAQTAAAEGTGRADGGASDPLADPPVRTLAERLRFLRAHLYPRSLGRPRTPEEVSADAAHAGHAIAAGRITALEDGDQPQAGELAALSAAYHLAGPAFLTIAEPDALLIARRIEFAHLAVTSGAYALAARHLDVSDSSFVAAALPAMRRMVADAVKEREQQ